MQQPSRAVETVEIPARLAGGATVGKVGEESTHTRWREIAVERGKCWYTRAVVGHPPREAPPRAYAGPVAPHRSAAALKQACTPSMTPPTLRCAVLHSGTTTLSQTAPPSQAQLHDGRPLSLVEGVPPGPLAPRRHEATKAAPLLLLLARVQQEQPAAPGALRRLAPRTLDVHGTAPVAGAAAPRAGCG